MAGLRCKGELLWSVAKELIPKALNRLEVLVKEFSLKRTLIAQDQTDHSLITDYFEQGFGLILIFFWMVLGVSEQKPIDLGGKQKIEWELLPGD